MIDSEGSGVEDIDPERMEATLEKMASGVDGATKDALETLADEKDIVGRKHLYQSHGFDGEPVTVEVELYGAELFAVMDMLDRVTDQAMPAHQFVPAASALSALIRASPTGAWAEWLAQSISEEPDENDDEAAEVDA